MIKKIVLDVLKPHEPTILEIAERLAKFKGIDNVSATLTDVEKDVEKAKITLLGSNIEFKRVRKLLEDLGIAIHAIDEVISEHKEE